MNRHRNEKNYPYKAMPQLTCLKVNCNLPSLSALTSSNLSSGATAVDIFDDYVVTFVGVKPGELYEEPLQFVLKSKLLADGYRKYFQFMWGSCDEE